MDHIIWECPAWAALRSDQVDATVELPPFVKRTWIPLNDLAPSQVQALEASFKQAVHILDAHTKHGKQCHLQVRHSGEEVHFSTC